MLDLSKSESLSKEELREIAPSIFSTEPSPEVSTKYSHIPTDRLIDDMDLLGWKVIDAKEVQARQKSTKGFQKHLVVFRNPDIVINDNEIKTRVIAAINEFFALENWEFGESFYFTELSTYVMQQLSPNLVTFVIVPTQVTSTFGSLFEIKSESDEIFISSSTVNNVELIDSVTATRLRSSGSIVTDATSVNTGIQSSGLSTTGGTY